MTISYFHGSCPAVHGCSVKNFWQAQQRTAFHRQPQTAALLFRTHILFQLILSFDEYAQEISRGCIDYFLISLRLAEEREEDGRRDVTNLCNEVLRLSERRTQNPPQIFRLARNLYHAPNRETPSTPPPPNINRSIAHDGYLSEWRSSCASPRRQRCGGRGPGRRLPGASPV